MKLLNEWDKNAMRDIIVIITGICVLLYVGYFFIGVPPFLMTIFG